MDFNDLLRQGAAKRAEAAALLDPKKDKVNDDEMTRAEALIGEADALEKRAALLQKSVGTDDRPPIDTSTGTLHAQPKKKIYSSLGEQLVDVYQATRPGAVIPARLLEHHRAQAAALGLSGVPSDGGFLLEKDTSADLMQRAYETGAVISRCFPIPVGENSDGIKINGIDETSRADGSRWGGIRVYRKAEAVEATASKPKFREIEMSLEDMIGLCYATNNMLRDARVLEAVIRRGFRQEFGFKMDDEAINGTGQGMMLGILKSDALVTVAKETGQAAKTVVYENICKMFSRLWGRSMLNAVWFVNQDVLPQLFQMSLPVGTGGAPVFLPPGGASGSPYMTLMGRPVIPIEQCQTLGTVGDIILADMGEYIVINKDDIQEAVSIHVQFLTNESAFRFVARNNGQPAWHAALTPKNGTNTVSPFVALATRA
jgi:HK97 family phage major capsid protein